MGTLWKYDVKVCQDKTMHGTMRYYSPEIENEFQKYPMKRKFSKLLKKNDIYAAGKALKNIFRDEGANMGNFNLLMASTQYADAERRPSAEEALERLDQIMEQHAPDVYKTQDA